MTRANMARSASTELPSEAWHDRTLADLIRYIIEKHHTYLREALPAIDAIFPASLTSDHHTQANELAAFRNVFRQFRREMEEHMKKEEAILFPMIEKLETARQSGQQAPRLPFGSIGHPISVMEQEHERARKELAEVRLITSDYTKAPVGTDQQDRLLQRLKDLEEDMETHSRLEDEILFPRAIGLEQV